VQVLAAEDSLTTHARAAFGVLEVIVAGGASAQQDLGSGGHRANLKSRRPLPTPLII
jgi:hypothetical protein